MEAKLRVSAAYNRQTRALTHSYVTGVSLKGGRRSLWLSYKLFYHAVEAECVFRGEVDMNPSVSVSVRRKLSDGRTGSSRAKGSQSEEHEGKTAPSSVSLPSSPSREEEPSHDNSTETPRRAGRSKGADTHTSRAIISL